jgi:hypothetical protein
MLLGLPPIYELSEEDRRAVTGAKPKPRARAKPPATDRSDAYANVIDFAVYLWVPAAALIYHAWTVWFG